MIISLAKVNLGGGGGGGMDSDAAAIIADAINALYEYMYAEGGLNDRITALEEGE